MQTSPVDERIRVEGGAGSGGGATTTECSSGVCGGFSSILPETNANERTSGGLSAPLAKSIRETTAERRGAWADGASAFDLIERRLFGFKNVNQIHLIRPIPDSTFRFIFYTLRAVPSGFLPLSGNYRALDTGPTCLWQNYMANRIRILILIRIRIRIRIRIDIRQLIL